MISNKETKVRLSENYKVNYNKILNKIQNKPKDILDIEASNSQLINAATKVFPYSNVVGCAVKPHNWETLEAICQKNYKVEHSCLTNLKNQKFDLIIVNPPFGSDTEYFCQAYEHLNEGGEILFVLPVRSLANQKLTNNKLWFPNLFDVKEIYISSNNHGFEDVGATIVFGRAIKTSNPTNLATIFFDNKESHKSPTDNLQIFNRCKNITEYKLLLSVANKVYSKIGNNYPLRATKALRLKAIDTCQVWLEDSLAVDGTLFRLSKEYRQKASFLPLSGGTIEQAENFANLDCINVLCAFTLTSASTNWRQNNLWVEDWAQIQTNDQANNYFGFTAAEAKLVEAKNKNISRFKSSL
jgi:hypothetical protein